MKEGRSGFSAAAAFFCVICRGVFSFSLRWVGTPCRVSIHVVCVAPFRLALANKIGRREDLGTVEKGLV
jgi:hypothetical protein